MAGPNLFPLLFVLLMAAPAAAQERVTYQVAYGPTTEAQIVVRVTLPGDPAAPLTLVMPRAVPMGYNQQLYDRYVSDLQASGRPRTHRQRGVPFVA